MFGADGEAIWLFAGGPDRPTLRDFVTGAVTYLTPFPDDNHWIRTWMRKPHGVVYGDGTIFLYSFVSLPAQRRNLGNYYFFTAAILRPGDMAWTVVKMRLDWMAERESRAAAYHSGKVLVWAAMYSYCVVTRGLVTGRYFRLPAGNRKSRAPPGFRHTGRKIPNFLKILNFNVF